MSDTNTMSVHRGNTLDRTMTVSNADGTTRDLTGATNLVFYVKRKVNEADSQVIATGTASLTDAANGIISLTMTPAATVSVHPGWYYWGVQLKETDGRLWELPRPEDGPGRIEVVGDIVRATP